MSDERIVRSSGASGLAGIIEAKDVRRLTALEAENVRLKKLVAERDLKIEATEGDRIKKVGRRAVRREGRGCEGKRPVAAAGLHAARGGTKRCRPFCRHPASQERNVVLLDRCQSDAALWSSKSSMLSHTPA
jgi:hypothetical protein